jgi:uncharacterized Zn-binding protein involved in type VI secretion
MRNASRSTDAQTCPGTAPKPHVGGTILPPCAAKTETFRKKQARVLDGTMCTSGGPGVIGEGIAMILVEGLPASGVGHIAAHAGSIKTGAATVWLDGPSVKLSVRDPTNQAFLDKLRKSLAKLFNGPTGTEWLNRMAASGHTTYYNPTTGGSWCKIANGADARTPGKGSDSDVYWNPDRVDDTGTSDMTLAHEMVHSMHGAEGTFGNGPYDKFPGQSGSSNRSEERSTVGTGGPVRQPDGSYEQNPKDYSGTSPTENSWRRDNGHNPRPSYYPKTWRGGAPW